jgi:hypothetical protein
VRCKNGEEAFRKLAQLVVVQADADEDAAAVQMIGKALYPLLPSAVSSPPRVPRRGRCGRREGVRVILGARIDSARSRRAASFLCRAVPA